MEGAVLSEWTELVTEEAKKVQANLTQLEKQLRHQMLLLDQNQALDLAIQVGQILRDVGKSLDCLLPLSMEVEQTKLPMGEKQPEGAASAADPNSKESQVERLRKALQAAITSVLFSRLVALRAG